MKNTNVRSHARSVKGKGNTTVRRHYRKGGAKAKDLTKSVRKGASLIDLVGTGKTRCKCGKADCAECSKKVVTKHLKPGEKKKARNYMNEFGDDDKSFRFKKEAVMVGTTRSAKHPRGHGFIMSGPFVDSHRADGVLWKNPRTIVPGSKKRKVVRKHARRISDPKTITASDGSVIMVQPSVYSKGQPAKKSKIISKKARRDKYPSAKKEVAKKLRGASLLVPDHTARRVITKNKKSCKK